VKAAVLEQSTANDGQARHHEGRRPHSEINGAAGVCCEARVDFNGP